MHSGRLQWYHYRQSQESCPRNGRLEPYKGRTSITISESRSRARSTRRIKLCLQSLIHKSEVVWWVWWPNSAFIDREWCSKMCHFSNQGCGCNQLWRTRRSSSYQAVNTELFEGFLSTEPVHVGICAGLQAVAHRICWSNEHWRTDWAGACREEIVRLDMYSKHWSY